MAFHATLSLVQVYLNGKIVPAAQAQISVFDRGFLFGDGLYEGLRAFDGRVVALDRHVKRMSDGLREIALAFDPASLVRPTQDLLRANNLKDAFIYWQVTRGTPGAGRPVRARIPPPDITPTVMMYCVPTPGLGSYPPVPTKIACVIPDLRWHRGHVKSISLLGNVLAALDAEQAGCDDAILARGDLAGEGTSANLIAVVPRAGGGDEVVTPSMSSVSILGGVTRDLLLESDASILERPLHVEELRNAREIMLCGTLTMITSITRLDGVPVGDGVPGPHALRLLNLLLSSIRAGH